MSQRRRREREDESRTKNDLAAIQYANKFVSGCLVVIDLEQL